MKMKIKRTTKIFIRSKGGQSGKHSDNAITDQSGNVCGNCRAGGHGPKTIRPAVQAVRTESISARVPVEF